MRKCGLCEIEWQDFAWFVRGMFVGVGTYWIEAKTRDLFDPIPVQSFSPSHCRKRSSTLRPARVRQGLGSQGLSSTCSKVGLSAEFSKP